MACCGGKYFLDTSRAPHYKLLSPYDIVTVLEKDTADAELSKQGDEAEKTKVEEARTSGHIVTRCGLAAILLSW
jgi:hypothetical protein